MGRELIEATARPGRITVAEPFRPEIWAAMHPLPARLDPRLLLPRLDSAAAASFRVLRQRLHEQGDPRVIAVSSAQPGEGKTTCAINLALALAECDRSRVLLIEANLRTPSLAAAFGFVPADCFAAQLQRHRAHPLDPWSLVALGSSTLHLLAVHPKTPPQPLVDGPALGTAIDLLKLGYDHLVLDTSPVLGSADVNIVAECADAVLLTARAGVTSGRYLRRAIAQLGPSKLLGVTLFAG